MEFDPIHKEEEEAMEMKISMDQSKSDPCLDLLLSSSDQSSSSYSSDSSLFSSLTSSPSHHGSFHGSSSITKTDEPHLSYCLLETISTDAPTKISALSQQHEGVMLGGPSIKAMVSAGDRIFSAHAGDPRIRVWMKTNKRSREDEAKRRKGSEPFIPEHKQIGSMPRRMDCFIKGLSQRNYVQVRRHEKRLWIENSDTISCLALGSIDASQVLYSGSWDKTIKVWRLKDLKCLEGFRAHHDAVQAMVASPDGFLYTSSSDGTIKVWRREGDDELDGGSHLSAWLSTKKKKKKKKKHVCIATLCGGRGHAASASVNSLALSNDGELLFSGGSDGVICIWGKGEGRDYIGELRESRRAHRLPVLCLCIIGSTIHGEVLLSGSSDKTVRIWKVEAHVDGIDGDVTKVSKSSIWKLNILGANNDNASTCHYHDNDALVTILHTTSKSNDDDIPLDSMPKSHRVGYSNDACMIKSCGMTGKFTSPEALLLQRKLQERSSSCGNGASSPDLHHNNMRGLFVHTRAHLHRIGMLEGHNGPVKSIFVSSNQHTHPQILDMDSRCIIYTRSIDETIKVWSLSHCNHNVLVGG